MHREKRDAGGGRVEYRLEPVGAFVVEFGAVVTRARRIEPHDPHAVDDAHPTAVSYTHLTLPTIQL